MLEIDKLDKKRLGKAFWFVIELFFCHLEIYGQKDFILSMTFNHIGLNYIF